MCADADLIGSSLADPSAFEVIFDRDYATISPVRRHRAPRRRQAAGPRADAAEYHERRLIGTALEPLFPGAPSACPGPRRAPPERDAC